MICGGFVPKLQRYGASHRKPGANHIGAEPKKPGDGGKTKGYRAQGHGDGDQPTLPVQHAEHHQLSSPGARGFPGQPPPQGLLLDSRLHPQGSLSARYGTGGSRLVEKLSVASTGALPGIVLL